MITPSVELFQFEPWRHGFIRENLRSVHLIGEFNSWGLTDGSRAPYALREDARGRYCALLPVPRGVGAYKFLLNETVTWPDLGLLYYSTVATAPWASRAIWYQIMVDRFFIHEPAGLSTNLLPWETPPDHYNSYGGSLRGIEGKLPHLREFFGTLKDKAFYLNPLHKSLASNHKYWPEDFETIDQLFGTYMRAEFDP